MSEVSLAIAAVVFGIIIAYSIWPMLKDLLDGACKGVAWMKTILSKPVKWLHDHMPENRFGKFVVKATIAVIAFPVTPTIAAVKVAVDDPSKAPNIALVYFVAGLICLLVKRWVDRKRKAQKEDFEDKIK